MPVLLDALRQRLRWERGFTMVTVLGALTVTVLFTLAALAAADSDTPQSASDQVNKEAYAAAEAGVNDYYYNLNRDVNYWTHCTNLGAPHALNNPWNGTGTDTRTNRRRVPGSSPTDRREYAIELLPAQGSGYTQCSEAAPDASMIDARTATFKIRSTGFARGEKRSIVATFRRKSFLDYIYFTHFETSDPFTYRTALLTTNPDQADWAATHCNRFYRDGRGTQTWTGTYTYTPTGQTFGPSTQDPFCQEINFVTGENIAGPLHTNDETLICGTPAFGRPGRNDVIEISGSNWRGNGGCGTNQPTFNGPWRPNSRLLNLPPSNTKLKRFADPAYQFTGKTTLVLNGSTMTVNGGPSVPLPDNGVIFVSTRQGGCGLAYDLFDPYPNPTTTPQINNCGDVYVSGSYSKNLTIGAERDIIVKGNLTRSGDTMIGLIANQFVRVYHPFNFNQQNGSCANDPSTPTNMRIEAAMLAINHSFLVDGYFCGASLGDLQVNGAIAQKWRGAVGQFGSTQHGYRKQYSYDDRLKVRQPPYFLDPVLSSWRVIRQGEQLPPR
jgi:Tfp pilus assembly protein PilX